MTLAYIILALCAIALAAWWFVRTMRRAHATLCKELEAMKSVLPVIRDMHKGFDRTLHDGLMEQERAVNLRLDRLCELLGYDTEDTGLEEPSTTEDAT